MGNRTDCDRMYHLLSPVADGNYLCAWSGIWSAVYDLRTDSWDWPCHRNFVRGGGGAGSGRSGMFICPSAGGDRAFGRRPDLRRLGDVVSFVYGFFGGKGSPGGMQGHSLAVSLYC